MKICPLMSYHKQHVSEIECKGEYCTFWNEYSNICLLREILLKQSDHNCSVEERIEKLEKDNRLLSVGFSPLPYSHKKDI